jgi:hypothetical protein
VSAETIGYIMSGGGLLIAGLSFWNASVRERARTEAAVAVVAARTEALEKGFGNECADRDRRCALTHDAIDKRLTESALAQQSTQLGMAKLAGSVDTMGVRIESLGTRMEDRFAAMSDTLKESGSRISDIAAYVGTHQRVSDA